MKIQNRLLYQLLKFQMKGFGVSKTYLAQFPNSFSPHYFCSMLYFEASTMETLQRAFVRWPPLLRRSCKVVVVMGALGPFEEHRHFRWKKWIRFFSTNSWKCFFFVFPSFFLIRFCFFNGLSSLVVWLVAW